MKRAVVPVLALAGAVAVVVGVVGGPPSPPATPVGGGRPALLVFVRTDCPISNRFAPELARIGERFGARGVARLLVYADGGAATHAKQHGLDWPIVEDLEGALARRYGATATPEAAVFDDQGRLAYRGRIDDRFPEYGKARPAPTRRDLADALEAVLGGRIPAARRTPVVGCPLSRPPRGGAVGGGTWSGEVATVIHDRCGSCHRPGGSGPFSLLTYADVSERAEQVAMVIEDGYMPPWKPVGDHGVFVGDRRLTPAQRRLVLGWIRAGAPEGDAAVAPPPPRWSDGWTWGPPDLVVTMDEPFEVPAEGSDIYRNFVLGGRGPDRNRPVKAWELDPGVPRAVHHALLSTDARGWARREDARDAPLGFGGMELGDVQAPDGFYLVWAPGRQPRENPAGLTWIMGPGVDLVLQLHMRPTGKAERLAARIGLWFADAPSSRPAFSLRVGDVDIDIPPGVRAHRIEDRFTLPIDVTVVSIFPHAHYLARTFEVRAGDTDLLRIDDWDFAWQDDYVYARPVRLAAGDEISLAVTYDNSADNPANPHHPPRRVQAGPRSDDEMGNVTLTLTPDRPAELPRLREAVYRRLTRRTPRDHRAWFNLGNSLKDGSPPALAAAVAAYAQALELSPDFVPGHVNKAIVHHEAGQEAEARRHATRALALRPNQPSAKATLALLDGVDPLALAAAARADLDAGRLVDAEAAFRRALDLAPDLAPAHTDLAVLLARRGALREAASHFEAALRLRPDDPAARANLERLRVALGAVTSP